MEWIPITVSVAALVLAGLAVLSSLILARNSPPGIVARAASQVEAVEADLDTRLRKLETDFQALLVSVDATLEETLAAAESATKRNRAAKRTAQAAEVAQATNGLDAYPPGHPDRLAAIEQQFRARGS